MKSSYPLIAKWYHSVKAPVDDSIFKQGPLLPACNPKADVPIGKQPSTNKYSREV